MASGRPDVKQSPDDTIASGSGGYGRPGARRGSILLLLLLAVLLAGAPASAGQAAPALRWLGVAGFALSAGDAVLLHDPYLSRPGLLRTLFSLYRPDADVLLPLLSPEGPAPELGRADLILVGHSHFDHLGDVPFFAARHPALVVGSPTTAAIVRAYGVPGEAIRAVAPGDVVARGPWEIRVLESRHARVMAGRVPLPGEVLEPGPAPIHAFSFKMGGALAYRILHRPSGRSLLVLSSAGLHVPALEASAAELGPVDVLLPASQGRPPGYARELLRTLRPRLVVPHHFDDFFRPLSDPAAAAPSDPEDLATFEAELREAAAAQALVLEIRRPELFESIDLETLR